MPRLNLIENPSFRNGTLAWTGVGGATLRINESMGFYGTHSLEVVKTGLPSSGVGVESATPVSASRMYAVSAYVAVPIESPAIESANVSIRLRWLTATGEAIAEHSTAPRTVTPSERWVRLSGIFTAPDTAAYAVFSVIQVLPGTPGARFLVDAVLLEQSSYVGGYVENFSTAAQTAIVTKALTPYQERILGGLKLQGDIMLSNLILNTIDENGVVWVCTNIEGWWNPAAPDIPDIARGVEDGSYNVSGRYTSRQITLTGVFLPPSPDFIAPSRDRLITASNLVREGGWLRSNESPTRAAFVRLSGRPEFETVNARGRTEFSLPLKAADPIKYHWNDNDNDGLTIIDIPGDPGVGVVDNIGTADVTATFELTGPLGSASTVTNTATNETITLVDMLRGNSNIATVTRRELYDNVVTLTTQNPHELLVGDKIVVFGLGTPFDATDGAYTVTAASSEIPYTLSYEKVSPNFDEADATGSVTLARRDVLAIDTYEKSVTLNGNPIGNRARVETLIDWIKLAPGQNTLVFSDNVKIIKASHKRMDRGVVTLKTLGTNYLVIGEKVRISFTEVVDLAKKSLTSNTITLTTTTDHGISTGDIIDVSSSEKLAIINKAADGSKATLTTSPVGDFAVGDNIAVELPVVAYPVAKSASSNRVMLTTKNPHGFSVGDTMDVLLPSTAAMSAKRIENSIAYIETQGEHGFSQGDSVRINIPVVSEVVAKTSSEAEGSPVVLTTKGKHYFAVGDLIETDLPLRANIEKLRYSAEESRVEITTTEPHGFAAGDRIDVQLGMATAVEVRRAYADTTTCTLEIPLQDVDSFTVGDIIEVSGLPARFNGRFTIESVPSIGGAAVRYAHSGVSYPSTGVSGVLYNKTRAEGYSGTKVLDSVTDTTLNYSYYERFTDAGYIPFASTSGDIINMSNEETNGYHTITAVTPTQITYNK